MGGPPVTARPGPPKVTKKDIEHYAAQLDGEVAAPPLNGGMGGEEEGGSDGRVFRETIGVV